MKNKLVLIFFLLLILPFIFLQFKSPHLFMTHDGQYHIERTFNYVNSLKEGNFPPNWTRFYNSGFGSPIFIFLFPMPYLISSLFYIIGFNLVTVLKLTFLFFQLIGIIAMYLWLKKGNKFSTVAALTGSMFYIYSPYNISQVLVRGSLREFAGTAVFPLVLFALAKLQKNLLKKNIAFLGLIFGIFLLTDGVSVALYLVIFISYLIYLLFLSRKKIQFVFFTFIALIIGVLISGYIYLPFVNEYQYVREMTTNIFQDHFIYFSQLFDYHWGFGFSMPGPNDGMSFQIGVINLLAIAIFIYFLIRKKIKFNLLLIFFLVQIVLYIFLLVKTNYIFTIWEQLPFLKIIQLPWRFLAPLVFITAFFAANIVNHLKITRKWFLLIYLLVILISFRYLRTNQIVIFDEKYLLNNTGDATAFHEFIPKWREKTSEFEGFEKIEITEGKGKVSNLEVFNNKISFIAEFTSKGKVRINTLYFPGWEIYINGKKVNYIITDGKNKPLDEKRDISGVMEIEVPQGSHQVFLHFTDTDIRKIGKIMTLVGVIIFFAFCF